MAIHNRPFSSFHSNILALIGLLGLAASMCVDSNAAAKDTTTPVKAVMVGTP